jgi:hypothetical protein
MRFDFEGRKYFDTSFNYRNQSCLISMLPSHFAFQLHRDLYAFKCFLFRYELALGSQSQSDKEENTSLSSFGLDLS